ncbi:MAG: pyridoxamine 5'-phosphate oxidase family protein [Candidatus Eremiobacteraeota bacterium]|nr:pyridoxamine 5'-phosphate oxidase family protein [Candidatus Eremiobacteraeota bacterium]
MFGKLTPDGIETLLREEIVGRIGYVDRRGLPCIAPITYAYDGRNFYGYSLLGAKIDNMGAHPNVCVEVDRVVNAADWCSVVARGTFEPLEGDAAVQAVERISDRLRTVAAVTAAPVTAWRTFVARSGGDGIAYRIRVTEKHGRYSSSERALVKDS